MFSCDWMQVSAHCCYYTRLSNVCIAKSFMIVLMLMLYLSLLSAHAGHQWLSESLLHCPSKLQHFPLKQEKNKSEEREDEPRSLIPSVTKSQCFSMTTVCSAEREQPAKHRQSSWERSKLLQTHLRPNRWMLSYISAIVKQLWAKVGSWASFALFPQGQLLSRFNECVSCVLSIYLQHLSCQNLTWSFYSFRLSPFYPSLFLTSKLASQTGGFGLFPPFHKLLSTHSFARHQPHEIKVTMWWVCVLLNVSALRFKPCIHS